MLLKRSQLQKKRKIIAKIAILEKELTDDDFIILRWSAKNYYQLTPRLSDNDGISFYKLDSSLLDFYANNEHLIITTKNRVNLTMVLYCNVNEITGHVGVLPQNIVELSAWKATIETANTNPHTYSIVLYNCVEQIF